MLTTLIKKWQRLQTKQRSICFSFRSDYAAQVHSVDTEALVSLTFCVRKKTALCVNLLMLGVRRQVSAVKAEIAGKLLLDI